MDNTSLKSYIQPIVYSVLIVFGILIGVYLVPKPQNTVGKSSSNSKIETIIDYAVKNYVDTVNPEVMLSDAINGMLQKLDPHSVYISAEEFNVVNSELTGNFEGIGIQFNIFNDTIMVVNTIAGGPSEKIGLMPGDRIVKVDTQIVAGIGISNADVIKKLKGPKGSKVKVGVKRSGVDKLLYFSIKRDVIPMHSVDIAFLVNPKTAYIKVNQFTATTIDEFNTSVSALSKKGIKNLMIDLRGNSGGFLNAAVEIGDQLLPKDRMIVYTEGRTQARRDYKSRKNGKYSHLQIAVLIDEWSASASEIVAGAVQDNDRGVVVGRRSFGKGLVQEQIPLTDGSAIRLTVARYHTPSGRCIQRYYKGGIEAYYTDMLNRYESGEMEDAVNQKIEDTTAYYTLSGRKVYGGGGIIPDIIVPLERNENKTYLNAIVNMGIIYRFAFDYVDKNRISFKKYKDSNDYISNYEVENSTFESLVAYATENGIAPDVDKINYVRNELKVWLKAFIGRNLFGDAAFYPIQLQTDKTFIKALEVLENPIKK